MENIIRHFAVNGALSTCTRFGCGHINETYLCTCDSGLSYILQKINKVAFKKPDELMKNIAAVTAYLARQSSNPRSSLHLVPTVDGDDYFVDSDGEYWRVYDFIASTKCLQKVEKPYDFYNSGAAFGRFQQQLSRFPAETLFETIPNFHNTRERFRQLKEALEADKMGRAAGCREEIEFALSHESECGILVDALASGELPTRVTHNDTKLNNILFDYETDAPLCIIDLDTVMPGSAVYDYGDSIRFGASTAAEDEKDLSKVWMDLDLFRNYTEGFLEGSGGSMTEKELELMPMGAKLMTYECGIRFLADWLSGDVYFSTHYEGQNLDRARTQFKLVRDMESKWEDMHRIVRRAADWQKQKHQNRG